MHTFTHTGGYSLTNTWTQVPTSGPTSTIPLNGIAVGTSKAQRIGNEVIIHTISMQGYVTFAEPGTGNVNDYVRLAIVLDKQANRATPTPGQVYKDRTGLTELTCVDFRDEDYLKRYRVISEMIITKPTSSMRGQQVPFRIDKKVQIKVDFVDTGNTYADISTNRS